MYFRSTQRTRSCVWIRFSHRILVSLPPPAISKKMGTPLIIYQRASAARQLQSGAPLMHVMHQFADSCRLVLTIKTDSKKIFDLATSTGNTSEIKTFRQPHFPMIDADVYQFVSKTLSLKFPVTRDIITQRALLVHKKLFKSEVNKKYNMFTVSKGWVENSTKRFGRRSVSFSGEAGIGDAVSVLSRI